MKSWLPGWVRKKTEPQMPPLVQDSFIELPFACQHHLDGLPLLLGRDRGRALLSYPPGYLLVV
mgnify:CR=1 FL=1